MPQANPYPLRIDQEVMDKIKVTAKNNNRSVNGEIEYVLKQYLAIMDHSPNIFLTMARIEGRDLE